MQREDAQWLQFWILMTGGVLLLVLTIGMQEAGLPKASAPAFFAAVGWLLMAILSFPPVYYGSQNAARRLLRTFGMEVGNNAN